MESGVSVIIPTFNRAEMLAQTLPSYLQSKLVQEVLLIDDGGSEQNRRQLEALAQNYPQVSYIQNETNLGLPGSRNRGIDLAQGDLILLTEDDLEIGENFIETLVAHMGMMQADIIAGRRLWIRIGESKENTQLRMQDNKSKINDLRWLDHNTAALTSTDVLSPLLSSTMLIRHEVTEKVRYFEQFGGPSSWREETDFQLSALQKGYRLVFCPHATSYHHSRLSVSYGANRLRGDWIYLRRIFKNNQLLLERHQEFLEQAFPSALILHNPWLTSFVYMMRKTFWLVRSEGYRWYKSRKHRVFDWK